LRSAPGVWPYLIAITIESVPVDGSTAHPTLAGGTGNVETAGRLDQHVQAHQQTESVFAPLVIDH
jgi:hypothetical protein